ncbi:MAG: hypothetical protein F6K42_19950 [Leptolyngbya sp. SIO1D8]|nr:hypothetical protein [Leptolyngbya sp. SIO1D8]
MRAWITALALVATMLPYAYAQQQDTTYKIQFDLDQLDEYGLYGSDGNKQSLSYKFCIPHDPPMLRTVQDIDPTLILYLQSPGLTGCRRNEMLAIGHTQQPNYREVLTNLTQLETVERIDQVDNE